MYYNGIDYYFFSGVKSVFRKMLNDKDIDNKDVIFVLKEKKFPFRTISRVVDGKEKLIGIYDKNIINSYFNTKEKCNEIRKMISSTYEDEVKDLASSIYTRKTNITPPEIRKQENKEKILSYLDKIPEEDMDYVSKQLLIDDEVMYESKQEKLSDVDSNWKPKEGLFLSKSPNYIAKYLLDHSKDKVQAMKRLTFYMNRAGDNLSNETVLNKVKDILKKKD